MQRHGCVDSSSKNHHHRSSGIKLTTTFSSHHWNLFSCQGRTLSPFLKAAVFLQTVNICLPGTTSNTTSPASEKKAAVCWHITTGHTEADRWTGTMTDCQPLQSAPSCTSKKKKKGRKTIKVWRPLSVGLLIPLKISLADMEGKWRWSTPSREAEKQECVRTNTQSRQAVIVGRVKKNGVSTVIPGPTGFTYVPSPWQGRAVGTDKDSPGKIRSADEPSVRVVDKTPPMAERQPINGIIRRNQASKVASEGGGAKTPVRLEQAASLLLMGCFLCSPHAKLLNNAAKLLDLLNSYLLPLYCKR